MREFTTPSVPIYMYDGEGRYILKTMGEVFIFLSEALQSSTLYSA